MRDAAATRHPVRAIAALLGLAVAAGCSAPAVERPNLVLITIDTLRPDRLECSGGPRGVGGSICRVASEGIRYRWAFSTAPSTAPAVASLLTSRYPAQHGVSEVALTRLAPELPTLAEILTEAGYRCGAVIANPVLTGERGFERGFERFDAELSRSEPNRPGYRERDASNATDAAIAWLEAGAGPWFLWVHYQDPHGPYEPPGAVPARDAAGEAPLRLLGDHSGRGGIPRYQRLGEARAAATYEQRYLDEIRFLDREIGRLFEKLDALDPEAGVLLTADHGEAFGEDGYWFAHGHALGFDQIRIPLLWRAPGRQRGRAGSVSDDPVSGVDVAPTLAAAARLPVPVSFAGRELPGAAPAPGAPSGEPAPRAARAIFAEHRLRAAVVIGNHYYARDRQRLAGPVADSVSGGWWFPMAPRRAELASGEGAPAYFALGAGPEDTALDALVVDFLARPAAPRDDAAERTLSPEARAALAALGYLD